MKARRSFSEVIDAWRVFIKRNVASSTAKRYEVSLRQLPEAIERLVKLMRQSLAGIIERGTA